VRTCSCVFTWRRESKGQRERAPARTVSWLGVCPSSWLTEHTEAAAGPVPPRWEERRAEGRSSRARSPSSPAAPHLCVIGSPPFLPAALRHRDALRADREAEKPLRGHPLTAVPNRRSQTARRAPPRLRAALFSQLRHRQAALNLPAKINSPRLFMPLPPRTLGTGESPPLRGQV